MNRRLTLLFLFSAAVYALNAQIKFRGSNIMEYQLGNLPNLNPDYQSALYDQLNLALRFKEFGLDARVEQYYPSFGEDSDYTKLSQLTFQYKSDLLDVEIGNLYGSFGRGLLLRTYEIPGSIWETRGYRVRYGFYRDLLGASLKFNINNWEIKAIRGEVLDVTLPPTIGEDQERRPDLVEGFQTSYRFSNQSVGVVLIRHITEDQADPNTSDPGKYLSLFYDGVVFDKLTVYGEVAKQLGNEVSIGNFTDEAAYGGYVGLSFYFLNFGGSVEYKDYHNFSLGTGMNDPPTLVKEHSYRTLNRSTHVPVLTDENGYQVEVYWSLENGSIVTFNTARSKNEISADRVPVFQEYFLEYQFYPGDKSSAKLFVDYAKDPFVNEVNRYATGGYVDLQHNKLSSTVELEWQYIQRETSVSNQFSNYYLAYTLSKASKYSVSAVTELTFDPVQIFDSKPYNLYPALITTYQPGNKTKLTLFCGKRRGGPACNSGVCYDVLDFKGLELRLNTRF